ncbi:FAD-binding oxidoreductase [Herbaspirillum sp. YR522]|uniref:NAD(P)/FAD-dependent oxidoreductase n=1 Tax=Herbaspirillum sp. YR522 TaxID=1144342 RepID=UPI00026FAB2E|nr:FAD-binding oxidoreductase [Herbaspirillum sp. YR522]EJN02836.1 glycine/D-amino acid oxidase, deaminating [Herbaspirillum sp. YR522]
MNRLDCDVLIVGGGIVGASAALTLASAGRAVALVERDLCGSRSSGINYGGVRRQGRAPVQLPLAQRAHQIWQRLPQLIGIDGEYVRTGHFKLARSQAEMQALEAYAELARPYGLEIELISGQRLRQQCPWLGGAALGGSLCVDDGQANPRLVSPAFARAAARAGAQVVERCEVLEVGHDGSAFVAHARHLDATLQLRAPVLLNCAGAWAGRLAEAFGEYAPMTSGHPSMAVTEPIKQFLPWSLGVEGGAIYCRQVARGNLVLGGGRGYVIDDARARASHDSILALLPQAVALLPALRHVQIIRTWSGVEGYLPDRQPVLGPSTRQDGLLHGFGFCGAGFQIGPAAGEALAELVLHGRSSVDLQAFSISRFSPSATPQAPSRFIPERKVS